MLLVPRWLLLLLLVLTSEALLRRGLPLNRSSPASAANTDEGSSKQEIPGLPSDVRVCSTTLSTQVSRRLEA